MTISFTVLALLLYPGGKLKCSYLIFTFPVCEMHSETVPRSWITWALVIFPRAALSRCTWMGLMLMCYPRAMITYGMGLWSSFCRNYHLWLSWLLTRNFDTGARTLLSADKTLCCCWNARSYQVLLRALIQGCCPCGLPTQHGRASCHSGEAALWQAAWWVRQSSSRGRRGRISPL